MKIIFEIPDEEVEIIKRNGFNKDGTFSFKLNEMVKQAMRNGVVLPNNATNGDIIKILFNETEYPKLIRLLMTSDSFWNAPYKGGQEDGKDSNWNNR